jgi:hypothetical protein
MENKMTENKYRYRGIISQRPNRQVFLLDHLGSPIKFAAGSYGPGNYASVQGTIERPENDFKGREIHPGLIAPTMAQTISLVHAAHTSFQDFDGEVSREVMRHLGYTQGDSLLWGFTGTLYVPNVGVFIQDNPEVIDGRVHMERSDLEQRLESNDPNIRFVPIGFSTDIHRNEIAKNPFIIGLAGEEGAQKLEEVAADECIAGSGENVHLYIDGKKLEEETISGVSSIQTALICGHRLLIGVAPQHACIGYSFGIHEGPKDSEPKQYPF